MTLRYRNKNGEWDRLELHAIPEIDEMAINKVKPLGRYLAACIP